MMFIAAVFEVMERADHHVFQILTKREKRLLDLATRYRFTQTFSATTYLVRRQSGYSYEEGSSRTIPVPVVP
jgi:protein gp37